MLQDLSDTRDNMTEMVRLVTLNITGMTCQSCVRNISTFLRDQPGVESVVVSLERATATVGYDWSVTDQHIIAGRTSQHPKLILHLMDLQSIYITCICVCVYV